MQLKSSGIIILIAIWMVSSCGCSFFLPNKKKGTADERTTQSINYYARGLKFEEEGKPDAALAEYKKANELSPRPAACYHLGLIYAAKADYPNAIANFEKAIELVPTFEAAKKELDRIKNIPR